MAQPVRFTTDKRQSDTLRPAWRIPDECHYVASMCREDLTSSFCKSLISKVFRIIECGTRLFGIGYARYMAQFLNIGCDEERRSSEQSEVGI
jgi:hypothetical protein